MERENVAVRLKQPTSPFDRFGEIGAVLKLHVGRWWLEDDGRVEDSDRVLVPW